MPMGADAVGLEHVEAVVPQQLGELVRLASHLASGDADVDPGTQLRRPIVVAAMKGLFHPVDIFGRQELADGGGVVDVPRRLVSQGIRQP